jgi:hypothetical protein
MNRDSGKPLRLFVNPFAAWTGLAFKTGEMLLAATQAGVARAAAARVAAKDNGDTPPSPARAEPGNSVAPAMVENNSSPRPTRRQPAKASKRVASSPSKSAKAGAHLKRKKRAR